MGLAIKIVRKNCNLAISVDTPRSAVAREAVKFGGLSKRCNWVEI